MSFLCLSPAIKVISILLAEHFLYFLSTGLYHLLLKRTSGFSRKSQGYNLDNGSLIWE